jgi:group I intron endonuclease
MSGRNHSDEFKQKISDALIGYKHSEKTIQIMSDVKKGLRFSAACGENHPNFGKNLSEETRNKISDARKGQPRPKGAGKPSQQIEVLDIKNNSTTSYDSIHEAARALNLSSHKIISSYIKNNQKKPYKARYTFSKKL